MWPRPKKTVIVAGKRVYHPLYFRWRAMKSRCYFQSSPEFIRYGARGIYICDEWLDFWNFVDWCERTMEEGKTIDRINNDGPYHPDNCRWATPSQQQQNARKTAARVAGITRAREAHKNSGWAGNMRRKRNSKGQYT